MDITLFLNIWEEKNKNRSRGYSNSVLTNGVSMRIFKLQVLSLFKLPSSISGENRSLNEHLRAKFGLK